MIETTAAGSPATNQRLVPSSLQANERGRLALHGRDLAELAAIYGTPAYLLDEQAVREACRAYRDGLARHYPGPARPLYAGKALLTTAIAALMRQEGMGLDVVSGGELATALRAGFPAADIFFHGNLKTDEELAMALEHGVGQIVVDNFTELEALGRLAAGRGTPTGIFLRVTPGIEAHTHEFIQTGQQDSKFGFDLATHAGEAVARVLELPQLQLLGLHAHIGSQIFDLEPFAANARAMVELLVALQVRFNLILPALNLGGGLGVVYTEGDDPPSIADYTRVLSEAVVSACAAADYPLPSLYCEPGRSIVGPAGMTLYRVGAAKDIPGVRRYVTVDGGMADNPRVITYGAAYRALPVQGGKPSAGPVTLAGRCCETGDILMRDLDLPELAPGDLLLVPATGAYNFSMASHYNRLPRPPLLLVSPDRVEVIVVRETYDDLMQGDRLPGHLAG